MVIFFDEVFRIVDEEFDQNELFELKHLSYLLHLICFRYLLSFNKLSNSINSMLILLIFLFAYNQISNLSKH